MADSEGLAAAFEEHRSRLRSVAYRLLGSVGDADDAVRDTWLRLAQRGRRRDPEPQGMADDGRGQGVAEHAPVAPVPE
jgi:DNA-directed RNA polymerase specialized sigma24 family protein